MSFRISRQGSQIAVYRYREYMIAGRPCRLVVNCIVLLRSGRVLRVL